MVEVLTLIGIAQSLVKIKNQNDNKNLMKEMVVLHEHQKEFLYSIDINIKAIQDGSLYAGIIYLSEAANEQGNLENFAENIREARKQFISYLGMLSAKANKTYQDYCHIGFAQLYVGLCYFLLSQMTEAFNWFNQAVNSFEESLTLSTVEVNNTIYLLQNAWKEKSIYDNKIYSIESTKEKFNLPLNFLFPLGKVGNDITYNFIKKVTISKNQEKNNSLVEHFEKELFNKKKFKEMTVSYKQNIEVLIETIKSSKSKNALQKKNEF